MGKFEKAFKDPEFLKLFEEYAKEVSDPKVPLMLLQLNVLVMHGCMECSARAGAGTHSAVCAHA